MSASPLPLPRGDVSERLIAAIRRPPHDLGRPPVPTGDPLSDDDLHLALYIAHELHYRSFAGVDDRWEWDPSLMTWTAIFEQVFEDACRAECGPLQRLRFVEGDTDVVAELRRVMDEAAGPSLSTYMLESGTLDEMREFAMHRSAYQLKEADPHTWCIPRLAGATKAALVHLQVDEYGEGDMARMHSTLFAETMDALGLDSTYGGYLDLLPGVTLATSNLVTMFGLRRRLRGALVGHLAVFESTSALPMARYSRALRRLGVGRTARRFYDVHLEADVEHEVIALNELAAGLAADEPVLVPDIIFGASALMAVEARFAQHLLDSWGDGRSSLRRTLEAATA